MPSDTPAVDTYGPYYFVILLFLGTMPQPLEPLLLQREWTPTIGHETVEKRTEAFACFQLHVAGISMGSPSCFSTNALIQH